MLSDRLFFPLIALISIGLVWAALAFGPRAQVINNPFTGNPLQGIHVSGSALALLQDGPGLVHKMETDADGEIVVLAAAGQRPDEGTRSAGVFLTVPPHFVQAWRGKTLQITMSLRQPETTPSTDASLQFYLVGGKSSGATSCPLSSQWQDCTISYTLPADQAIKGTAFIGLWPDTLGLSRYVAIRSLNVRIMPKPPSGLRKE